MTPGTPRAIDEVIVVREVDDGPGIAGAIFERRYKQAIPDFPLHVVAFHRGASADASELPVNGPANAARGEVACCYIHFTIDGELIFGGGACVDDRVLRAMPAADRAAVKAAGGLYFHTLSWSVRHFEGRFDAVFGYCGDALAKRIDLAAGFSETTHDKLLVRWLRPLDASRQAEAMARAAALMPF
jgi:hypothetical protein